MISKSIKTKRRLRAADAAQILDTLLAAVPAGAGKFDGVWPPCHTLNEATGRSKLALIALEISRYPKGSEARQDAAFYAGSAEVCSALGNYTPEQVLLKAGLL